MNRARLAVAVTVSAISVSCWSTAVASATPSSNVQVRTLAQSSVDGKDYVTKEITIGPGGSTGWHYHPGEVFGVIRAGTLTHDVADCSIDGIYPAGAPITEGSGPDDVHIGRNLGTEPVVMWVVYINSVGDPLAIDVPNPGCPFE